MYFADVYSAQYAPGRQTTVKLIREFNYCDLNRGKIRVFFFLFLLSEYIEWPLMRRISVKILVFDVWDALKPMYASKLSKVTGYLTVFHYHEATQVNIHSYNHQH